jgi:zinc transporter ZupT
LSRARSGGGSVGSSPTLIVFGWLKAFLSFVLDTADCARLVLWAGSGFGFAVLPILYLPEGFGFRFPIRRVFVRGFGVLRVGSVSGFWGGLGLGLGFYWFTGFMGVTVFGSG